MFGRREQINDRVFLWAVAYQLPDFRQLLCDVFAVHLNLPFGWNDFASHTFEERRFAGSVGA